MDAQSPKDDIAEELARLADDIPAEIDIDAQAAKLVAAARGHRKSASLLASLAFRGAHSMLSQRLSQIRRRILEEGARNATPHPVNITLDALKEEKIKEAIERTKLRADKIRNGWGKLAMPFQGEKPLYDWAADAAIAAAEEQIAQGETTARRGVFVREVAREAQKRSNQRDIRIGDVLTAKDGDYIYVKTEGAVVIKKTAA